MWQNGQNPITGSKKGSIQAWAAAVAIEQFLKGVEERASNLSGTQRESVQERLRLAREFIGVQDPPGIVPLLEDAG